MNPPGYRPAPVSDGQMTIREQFRYLSGPRPDNVPNIYVIDPGPGGWYFDDATGVWRQQEAPER